MDLDVLFLGTAASAPTARRGLPATLIRRGGEKLLFDCGEGTQRQLVRSVGLVDIDDLFITHFHADHVLGIPGLLKTYGLQARERRLRVYGPAGLRAPVQVAGAPDRAAAVRDPADRAGRRRRAAGRGLPPDLLQRGPRRAGAGLRAGRGRAPGPLRPGPRPGAGGRSPAPTTAASRRGRRWTA